MLRRMWEAIKGESSSSLHLCVRLGGIVLVLTVAFGTLFGAAAAGIAWTSTESFCISCHELRENAYAEFKDTIHDTNRSGVRAECADCHVPRELIPKLMRKLEAVREVYGHLVTGVIDTREKSEAHRYQMAKREWARLKRTDSLECRHCHQSEAMSSELQSGLAKARHEKAKAQGKTCIDCHYGIAHREPDGPGPSELGVSGGN